MKNTYFLFKRQVFTQIIITKVHKKIQNQSPLFDFTGQPAWVNFRLDQHMRLMTEKLCTHVHM